MTPWEAMQRMTERQLRIVLAWLDAQFDRPDRNDYYLMQIARETAKGPSRVWGKEPDIDLNKFKLSFNDKPKKDSEASAKLRAKSAKMRVLGMLAMCAHPLPVQGLPNGRD